LKYLQNYKTKCVVILAIQQNYYSNKHPIFNRDLNLAVILTEGSPLRDKINRAPLSERAQREWCEKTTDDLEN